MSAHSLSSRDIKGEFFATLESSPDGHWVTELSLPVKSDQAIGSHAWISAGSSMMREWIGGREASGFWEDGIEIVNRKFEGTFEVLVDELRRDKTGQIMLRTRELASRSTDNWADLITALVKAGETGIGYAGETFFNAAHVRGITGLEADPQSNLIDLNIPNPTSPTGAEILAAVNAGMSAILKFRDYEGDEMNDGARHFCLFVPMAFVPSVADALDTPAYRRRADGQLDVMTTIGGGYTIRIVPRLHLGWTDRLAVFRADGTAKPFIRQEEFLKFASVGPGSELEFNEEKHHYGVATSRNGGYGLWEHACLVRFI